MSLRHVILTALAESPASGYDIAKSFEQTMRFYWSAKHQQVYRDIKALAVEGLVEAVHVAQTHRPDKVIYRLTDKGRSELRSWVATAVEPRINSEFLVKLLAASAFGTLVARDLLRQQRTIHAARLALYQDIEQNLRAHANTVAMPLAEHMRVATLRRGLRGEKDWIDWIDESLKLIADIDGTACQLAPLPQPA